MIREIEFIINNEIIKSNMQYIKKIDEILKRYKSKSLKIGILGEFSSGKSTLINALLGNDILNHGTVETTATVTKILNREDDTKKIVVHFNNGKCIEKDNYKDILMYTTTKGDNVINNVSEVDIYTTLYNEEFHGESYKNLVLIDTPGLNGMADKHREVTIEEIKGNHCCIYVLQKNGLSQWDREFLPYIFNYQNNFIFVQNFIDEIKKSEGETVDKKLGEIDNIINKIIDESNKDITYNLVGVSALKALCGRDRGIKKLYQNDLLELNDRVRTKLIFDSNINELETLIINHLNNDEQNKIKEGVTLHSLKVLISEIVLKESNYLSEERLRLAEGEGYKDIRKAEREVKQLFDNREVILNNIYTLLESDFIRYRKILYKYVEKEINKINDLLVEEILSERSYDEFKLKEKNGHYINILNKKINDLNLMIIENEEVIIQEIYKNILSRLNYYTGYEIKNSIKISNKGLNLFNRDGVSFKFNNKEDEIKVKKMEFIKAKSDLNSAIIKDKELSKDYKYEHDKYVVSGIKKKRLKINLEKSLTSLGQKSYDGESDESIIRIRESREGLCGVLLGTRIIKKIIPCFINNSNKEWENKKREIDIQYFKDVRSIENEMLELKNRVNIIEEKLIRNNYVIERNKEKVEFLMDQIKVKEEELKTYENKAKGDYLKVKKKELLKAIEIFLFGGSEELEVGVVNTIKEKIDMDFMNNKTILEKEVSNECFISINKECERINGIINGYTSVEKINKMLNKKENSIKELIGIIENLEVNYIE